MVARRFRVIPEIDQALVSHLGFLKAPLLSSSNVGQ